MTPSPPTILAFDTSGPAISASVLKGGEIIATRHEEMAKGQAERLFPLLEDMLQDDAGLQWFDLAAIAVGIGPGNFTGIRISVSAARGLSLSLGIPAVGVSLLEAMAHGASGSVLARVQAPRGRSYLQIFDDADPRAPALVEAETAQDWVRPGLVLIGHDSPTLAAVLGMDHAPAAFAPTSAIARVAALKLTALSEGETLPAPSPLYLRQADAAPSSDQPPVLIP